AQCGARETPRKFPHNGLLPRPVAVQPLHSSSRAATQRTPLVTASARHARVASDFSPRRRRLYRVANAVRRRAARVPQPVPPPPHTPTMPGISGRAKPEAPAPAAPAVSLDDHLKKLNDREPEMNKKIAECDAQLLQVSAWM